MLRLGVVESALPLAGKHDLCAGCDGPGLLLPPLHGLLRIQNEDLWCIDADCAAGGPRPLQRDERRTYIVRGAEFG